MMQSGDFKPGIDVGIYSDKQDGMEKDLDTGVPDNTDNLGVKEAA